MNYSRKDIVPLDCPTTRVCKTGEVLFYNYGSMSGNRVTTGDIYVTQPAFVLAREEQTIVIRPATGRDI